MRRFDDKQQTLKELRIITEMFSTHGKSKSEHVGYRWVTATTLTPVNSRMFFKDIKSQLARQLDFKIDRYVSKDTPDICEVDFSKDFEQIHPK